MNDTPDATTVNALLNSDRHRAGLNDLLAPFRFLRQGKGLGSLFCLPGTEETETEDPAAGNLEEFVLCWSDTYG